MPKTNMNTKTKTVAPFRVTLTLDLPSYIYRYRVDCGLVEVVFRDRDSIITYPKTHPRGAVIYSKLLKKGVWKLTKPRQKRKNANTN
jgi:hypothetical protein